MLGTETDRCPYCGGDSKPCDCPNAEIVPLNMRIVSLEEQLDHWSARAIKAEASEEAARNNIRNLLRFARMVER